jgi:hypothetical protein
MSSKSKRIRDEEDAKDEPMTKLKKREKKRQSLERLLASERKFFEDRMGLAQGGFTGDDVLRVLLGEGLLATLLSFGELTRLGGLNRRFRRNREACDLARPQHDLRQRGARAHAAASSHAREGGAREGARAADD